MDTLVIQGHPHEKSFCNALMKAYMEGREASGNSLEALELRSMKFDPVLWKGYSERQNLEPDLIEAQEKIRKADKIVFFYPVWWATLPALLKGFFDRLLLPGFAYQSVPGKALPKKLLKGKEADIFITMDSPAWYQRLTRGGHKHMINGILEFCGIRTRRVHQFTPIKTSTQKQRDRWLQKAYSLGYDSA